MPDLVVVGEAGLGSDPDVGPRQVVSDEALTSAREVLLHADSSDRILGAERLDRLGLRARRIAAGGTPEDIALLVAHHADASLIVTVGTHTSLEEFLDKQRSGMSSSFLTRLRVGSRVIDAKTVPTLYSGRVRLWHLWLVLLVGLVALGVAVAATPVGSSWGDEVVDIGRALQARVEDLLP